MELGPQNGCVALHQGQGMCLILQILHVAQLVDLVIADGLNIDQRHQIGQISLAGSHDRHTRTGEGNLAGGGELIHHIGIAVFGAEGKNVVEGNKLTIKFMDAVGVIPHEHEVRSRRLHGSNAADGLIGINNAIGVGVLRHIPHSLYSGVLNKLLHHVHIRSIFRHRNSNELRTKGLGHLKVTVVAGSWAQPLYLFQLAPGLLGVEQAMGICLGNGVIHQLQAGVAAYKALLRLAAQNLRKQGLSGGQTVHIAVVTAVDAVGDKVLRLYQNIAHLRDHIQLLSAGLSASHVQLQPQGFLLLVLRQHSGILCLALLGGHFRVFHHGAFLLFRLLMIISRGEKYRKR